MESDEGVIVIFKGMLVDLLVTIDPNIYRKYVVIYRVVKLIYVRLQKYF